MALYPPKIRLPARHKEYKRNFKFDFRTFFRLNHFTFISPPALESSLCLFAFSAQVYFSFPFFNRFSFLKEERKANEVNLQVVLNGNS